MVSAWSVHGECMVSAWLVHGECMVSAWSMHDQCMVSAWSVHGQCMVSACVSIVAKVLFPAVFSCLVLILPQSHVRRMFLVCLYQTPQIFSRYLSSIFW
jgi:hypothetical protein